MGDVLVQEGRVHMWIRKSKINQLGRGAHFELGAVPQVAACPVGAVHEWLCVRPSGPGSLLVTQMALHCLGISLRLYFVNVCCQRDFRRVSICLSYLELVPLLKLLIGV